MFSPKRPVHQMPRTPNVGPKVARPYGQTKRPEFHPRKAYPASPPTPFDLRGARRAYMRPKENVAPAPAPGAASPGSPPISVPPRRRYRPRTEATDYPPPEEFKNMRVIAPPPSRFPGNQIYVDRDDAVQPLVDQLKAQGPLHKDDQLMLQGLARLRIEAMMREAYHNQAVVVETAIAEFPRLDRYRKLKEAGERKRRAMREQRERELLEKQGEERRAKERLEALQAAALKREMERRRRERQLLEEERRRKLAEAEEQRRRQKAEAEARRRREREEAERLAELERLRELHIHRLREMEEQKRKEAEMRRRWEELQRERERQMKEEQERAAREAEEAARRAREEQERAARERLAQEKERLAQEDANMHLRQICDLYERKWTELKTNRELQNIVSFFEFPFPVFTYSCTSPSDITYERVREFLFHPFRPSIEGKSRKEILKVEVLRWHPDKFDTLIFPKMRDGEWEATKEAAGLVARWVTRLMAEE